MFFLSHSSVCVNRLPKGVSHSQEYVVQDGEQNSEECVCTGCCNRWKNLHYWRYVSYKVIHHYLHVDRLRHIPPLHRIHQKSDRIWHQGQQVCEVCQPEGEKDAPLCHSCEQETLHHWWTFNQWSRRRWGSEQLWVLWPKDRHMDIERDFAV